MDKSTAIINFQIKISKLFVNEFFWKTTFVNVNKRVAHSLASMYVNFKLEPITLTCNK